jgi:hypothetical protein
VQISKIGAVGTCLLACACVWALASSTALAAPPEVGRCATVEKVQEGARAHYHGGFANRTCTKASSSKDGHFEWEAGPGTTKTFTDELSGTTTVETVGGRKVLECQLGKLEGGEYTGPKTEKFSGIELSDCVNAFGKGCLTDPAEAKNGVEDLTAVEGELGVISAGATPTIGWDLKGVRFLFNCGAEPQVGVIGEQVTIEGSVIGVVSKKHGGDLNRMSETTFVPFSQAKGKQLPEAFEGASADTLTTIDVDGADSYDEQSGLASGELDRYSEPLETRSVE